jgi:two-component system cell cycle sensor histidine kinase/response regulator CckA
MSTRNTQESGEACAVRPGRSVLLVDDDPIRLERMRSHLTAKGFLVRSATGASEALACARADCPEAIIIDVDSPHLDGFVLTSLLRCEESLNRVPIILVTSDYDAGARIAAAAGAQLVIDRSGTFDSELDALVQFLDHDGLLSAAPCVLDPYVLRMASRLSEVLAQSHAAEDRWSGLFNSAQDAITMLTPDGFILEANRGCEQILQTPRESMVGHHIREFAAPGHEDSNVAEYRGAVDSGTARMPAIPIKRLDGTCVYIEWSNKAARLDGKDVIIAVGRDVTERVEARQKEAASEEKYRTLIESLPDVVWSSRPDGKITFISPTVTKVCGFSAEELLHAPPSFWFERVHREDVDRVRQAYADVASSGYASEYRWQHKDGHWVWIRAHASMRTRPDGVELIEGTFADVTEIKHAEEQVRQSQKMEAVGQLTGGIAHDFNNILAVILGNGDFLRQSLAENDPRRADADAILEAGQRAAGLTRQLLAFSRRQVLEPRVLDLNQIVQGLERMLGRIIGEDIEFSTALAEGLNPVHTDAGQIEQVIMNLVVNARDAMPVGGRLSIETANVVIDEGYARAHLGAASGAHVMLAVSDTGSGIDASTKRHLFEPFFTTKERGKGTGLGLSTCYGIVKQSGGWIWVYSELGQGTVFKVYLPVAAPDAAALPGTTAEHASAANGHETVLVIEDDAQVRTMVRRILTSHSYNILEARDGDEAVAVAKAHAGAIDLILSDVVIPGVSGPEIVQQVQRHRGGTRSLFMSGYTDHAVLRDRILAAGANFIQKPFAPVALANKVREVLDAPQQVSA